MYLDFGLCFFSVLSIIDVLPSDVVISSFQIISACIEDPVRTVLENDKITET